MENDKTTLWLSKETRDRLAKRGDKNDSFDRIINNILDETEESIESEEFVVSNLFNVKDHDFKVLKLPNINVIKARISKNSPLPMYFESRSKRHWITDVELRRRLEKFLRADYEGE